MVKFYVQTRGDIEVGSLVKPIASWGLVEALNEPEFDKWGNRNPKIVGRVSPREGYTRHFKDGDIILIELESNSQ